jgi:cytochrome P450
MIAGSLLGTDPPEHREIRNMVRHLFKQSVANDLEPVVRRFVRQLLDKIEPGEPFDLVTTASAPLPFLIVGELLGIDDEERARLEELVDAALAYEGGGASAVGQAFEFFTELVARRRGIPGDDLVSGFCAGTATKQLEDWEVIQSTFVVVMGASETVRALITQGLLVLRDHPEALARLQADAGLIPGAVDELLRYITPINYYCRTAAVTHQLHDVTIDEGDVVMVLLAAANRDRSVFGEDADLLVIDRDPNPHLAFGFGEHFCLGAPMGRLQGRIFFEEWMSRFAGYDLAGEPQRSSSTQINIIEHLPLVARSA